jgi:DNA primase
MSDYEAVLEIAKQHLHKVKRSGPDNIMASCPFHVSDSPHGSVTFSMSLSRGIYYCFSCHASGDLRRFLNDIGVAPYAIKLQYDQLIERLRVKAPPTKDIRKFDPKANEALPENLLGIFDYCPTRLREVGFREETLRSFDVGFDFYHNMVTFPLRDMEGQLVGISGRRTEGDGPRYKIYKEEYKTWGLPARKEPNRSVLLWNFHRAVPECLLANRPIILVEGFKACMWVWQAGYTNVVAILGSKVTKEQQWLLEQYGFPVILMLDGNEAGRDGTLRSGRWLQKSLLVRVARLPEEEQPDDLTVEQIHRVVEDAVIFQKWSYRQPGRDKWQSEDRTWGRTRH